jgi:hypothetical protein
MKRLLLILLLGLVQVQAQVGVLDLADPVFLGGTVNDEVGGGGGEPAFVEEVGRTVHTVSTETSVVTLSSGVASGNTVAVLMSTSLTVSGITDTAGNTYSEALAYTSGSPELYVWYSVTTSPLSASDTVTVTWTSASYAERAVVAVELSGVSGVDVSGGANDYATTSYITQTTTDATVAVGISAVNGSTWSTYGGATQIGAMADQTNDSYFSYEEFASAGSNSHGGTLAAAVTHPYMSVWFK